VRDSGPGLRPEEIGKLFRPFVQSEAGKSMGGTGLGLAISRQYARLLGGDITVESKPGEGATFSFSFLAASAKASDVASQDSAPPVSRLAPGQTVRVLVADDVEASRTLIFHLLTELGFEVRVASNGAEALAVFREWMPHAVLMDMRMPVMDGYEAIRRIKAAPRGRDTFVLALTASACEEDKAAVLACGANEFLRKPFKENELVGLLGRHLHLRFQGEGTAASKARIPVLEVDFSTVPEALRARLLKAAGEAYYDELLVLCDKLAAAGHHEAAETLRSRINAFDYIGVSTLLGTV
jgi:CheY-like chemotaxis protein